MRGLAMPGGGRRRCQVSWCPQQPLVTAISALKQRSPTPGLHTSTGRGLSEPAAQQEVSSWRGAKPHLHLQPLPSLSSASGHRRQMLIGALVPPATKGGDRCSEGHMARWSL